MNHVPRFVTAVALVAALLSLGATAFARDVSSDVPLFQRQSLSVIEENLTNGLKTNSPAIRMTTLQTLQQMKNFVPGYEFSTCVIPLMAILKNEGEDSYNRILAAVILHGLETARGDFAISRTVEFTNDQKLKKTCKWLTIVRNQSNNTGFAENR
jgi:hypothetical protein